MELSEYAQGLHVELARLVEWTRSINELDLAGSLMVEFRGMQDAGWSTAATAYEVHSELRELAAKGSPLTAPELRQVLCLYCQLAESGGVYEVLHNLLNVIQTKPYSGWPFHDMVKVRQTPKRVIGPNSNAMFRRLAETARNVGMKRLSTLLEVTFRDDIRNAIFHADYILARDGLRLRRRNGGQVEVISYAELERALSVGLAFFELLDDHQRIARESFRPARTIIGRFSLNPPMPHTVEFAEDGRFSISTSSPGPQIDEAYERQQLINKYLGGRVFTAFAPGTTEKAVTLLTELSATGYEIPLVVPEDSSDYDGIKDEIEKRALWRTRRSNNDEGKLLLVTPSGFAMISGVESFNELLPNVDPLEIS